MTYAKYMNGAREMDFNVERWRKIIICTKLSLWVSLHSFLFPIHEIGKSEVKPTRII